MRALIFALVAAGILCGAALLAMGCTDDNPAYRPLDPAPSPDLIVSADLAVPPDLDSTRCGQLNDPCCYDQNGRTFCQVGECVCGICTAVDMAPPPDLMPPGPDLAWRPDLTGGACVGRCGLCSGNYQCCTDPQEVMNCIDERGALVQGTGRLGKCAIGVGVCTF